MFQLVAGRSRYPLLHQGTHGVPGIVPWYQVSQFVGGPNHFFVCGPVPPVIAFPRGFFAEARTRLVCNGRRRGSSGSAPWRLHEALPSDIYDESPKNRAR